MLVARRLQLGIGRLHPKHRAAPATASRQTGRSDPACHSSRKLFDRNTRMSGITTCSAKDPLLDIPPCHISRYATQA
jgi:hypothetical protein